MNTIKSGLIANKIFVFFFVVLSSVFLLHYKVVGQAVYGDGRFYYSITRSIYKDHNINFLNEFEHHWSRRNNNTLNYDYLENVKDKTPTGLYPNKYAIGAPIIWLIPFSVSDTLAKAFGLPSQGYSDIYQLILGIFNCFIVTVSIYLIYKFLLKFFNKNISIITSVLILFGTNIFYYGSIDVINSHPTSFFAATLFITYWYTTIFQNNLKRWAILGALIGFLTLTRTQDIIFGILIISENIFYLLKQSRIKLKTIIDLITRNFIFSLSFLIIFSPQMIMWKILYGNYYVSPYISGGESFNFLHPQIIGILFSGKVGLFIWTPLFAVSIAGLFYLLKIKKIKHLAIFSLTIILCAIYLVSSWSSWSQGESYGLRMLISVVPFMAIGLGQVVSLTSKRYGLRIVYIFSIFFIILNLISIIYFLTIFQNPTFDRGQVTQLKF